MEFGVESEQMPQLDGCEQNQEGYQVTQRSICCGRLRKTHKPGGDDEKQQR